MNFRVRMFEKRSKNGTQFKMAADRIVQLWGKKQKVSIFKVRPLNEKNVYRSIYNSKTLSLEGS